jgi:RimJ/RimL family protein N-acetyltransferase
MAQLSVVMLGGREKFWTEYMFVGLFGAVPVGYCRLTISKQGGGRKAWTDVWVDRKVRGRGVGHALKDAAIAFAFREKVEYLETWVRKGNQASLANCLSHGYRIDERRSTRTAWALKLRKEHYKPYEARS